MTDHGTFETAKTVTPNDSFPNPLLDRIRIMLSGAEEVIDARSYKPWEVHMMKIALRTMGCLLSAYLLIVPQQFSTLFGQQCSAATQNLVSYWNFDETSGLAIDHGDGNNGFLGSGVTRVPGILGSGAVSFNNTPDAYINVGAGINNDFSFSTGVTISVMTKPQWTGNFGDYDDFFRKDDGNNRMLLAFQNDNGVCCPFFGGGGKGPVLSFGLNVGGVYDEIDMPLDGISGRPTLAHLEDGNAHWILATYDSTTGVKAIYIDGVMTASKLYPKGSLISSGGTSDAIIGNWETSVPAFGEPFNGVMDEVRIYKSALSPSQFTCIQFSTFFADVQKSLSLGHIANSGIAQAITSIVTAAELSVGLGNLQSAADQFNGAILLINAQSSQNIDPATAQRLISELGLLRSLTAQ